jgi:hypothetical protein
MKHSPEAARQGVGSAKPSLTTANNEDVHHGYIKEYHARQTRVRAMSSPRTRVISCLTSTIRNARRSLSWLGALGEIQNAIAYCRLPASARTEAKLMLFGPSWNAKSYGSAAPEYESFAEWRAAQP